MLKHLDLINFRNYEKYSIDFTKTTILIGPNGVGKTNVIEAAYILSTGRSWRTSKDTETIKWGEELAKITCRVQNSEKFEIDLVIQNTPSPKYPQTKIVKINGVNKKLTELLGKIPTVLFSPEEIQIVSGAPVLRRRFLDILLCQIDKRYTLALLDLAKIIRGRNKLLYFIKIGRSKINELVFWDEKLVVLGSYIIKKRQQAIDQINENLTKIYTEIAGEEESLLVKYKPTVQAENFTESLIAIQGREVECTSTLLGPHRDDMTFLLENKDVTTFGSRGEFRSVVLALKMAELEYLAQETSPKLVGLGPKGERPILLLDDIFSELDKDRRYHLAKLVENQQAIITTTDLDHIDKRLREKAKIVELK
ncbi:MAG: replication and repair protein RecF protein [Candidatus Berkelbacteria bacterium]|nr:replication and repair protein RecF protein [Candidatus Berkelbacteria bacterium]